MVSNNFSAKGKCTSQLRKEEIGSIIEVTVMAYPPLHRRSMIPYCEAKNDCSFRVLSYNILAETSTNYRRRRIMDEVIGYRADILCFQEMTVKAFDYFEVELDRKGFTGIFMPKWNRDFMGDGCAIFFRQKRFKLVDVLHIQYHRSAMNFAVKLGMDRHKVYEYLRKVHFGLCVILETIEVTDQTHPKRICVGNTHLIPKSARPTIQYFQIVSFIEEVKNILAVQEGDTSLILAGDFNNTPDSAVHKYLTTGRFELNFDSNLFNELEKMILNSMELNQGIPLVDAYDEVCLSLGAKRPTTFIQKGGEELILDYIFYSGKTLHCEAVLGAPTVTSNTGILSIEWPSDHFAILAELRIKE